jgi:CubicO group peptidase (beta-lactamase class C family)
MNKLTYILLICLFFVLELPAQTASTMLQESPAAQAGFSPASLDRLDHFIQAYVDRSQMNGATALVARNGRIVYYKAFGYADLSTRKPLRKDHIFRIASMTKPVISVAAMMLYEEGKFNLDDPLSKFIPAFKSPLVITSFNLKDTSFTTEPAKSEITVRQILNHTSGLGYAQIGSAEANALYYKNGINGGIGTPGSNLKEMITKLAGLPLFQHPGEKFLYGLNTDVLGYLVEVLSGMPLDKYLEEKMFKPLGMRDTYFYLPAEKQSRLVKLYKQDANAGLLVQDAIVPLNGNFHTNFPLEKGGTYFSGGAGLSSTAYDYAVFCQMLLNGGSYGNRRILSPSTIRLMTMNQIGGLIMWNDPNNPNKFGLGFGVYTEGSEKNTPARAGSYDWGGMFATHFWIDPQSKLVAVFMRNVWPTAEWDFGDRVKAVVYGAMEE